MMTTPSSPNQQLSLDVLKKLPKAELHRHLDGSVRIGTIIDLAKEQNVSLPTFDEEELRKLVSVNMECESLMEYLRGFEITLKVLQKPYALTRVMYEVCEDAVNDGVRYLEVRFSPILHVQEGLSLTGVMEAVTEGLTMAEYNLSIKVGIIICGMRHMSAKTTKNLAEIAWRYRHKGVLGFDLAGPEDGFSSKDHKDAFNLIRAKYINVTLHSGEAAGPKSIEDSIRYCGAHRIGHGTRLGEDPELMQFVIDRRIALECCLTSNVQTKAINLIENHPIKKYFDAGVIVIPCCDNTTVSSVTLSGEYFLLQKLFNFSIEEIVRMIDYGFAAAFIPESEKRRYRAEVLRSCIKILTEEGYSIRGILENSHYYDNIGVDIGSLLDSPASKLPVPLNASNDITLDIIRDLPKADLHTRFDGSVSIATLWKEVQKAGVDFQKDFGIECNSYEEFKQIIQPANHNPNSITLAKKIQKTMLQLESQLERATVDIFTHAKDENVKYMELVIRPKTHTKRGLSINQVIEILLRESKKMETVTGVKFGLILYVSMNADDPIDFRTTAELAVQYKGKGIVGFGVFGDDSIPPSSFQYFKSTFNYLKSHSVNVVMFAADVSAISNALHDGGAGRISGGFQAHQFPRLMNYLAVHKIPLELSLTNKLKRYTEDITAFGIDPIRLFLDQGINVTVCSFRGSLSSLSRSEIIYNLVKQCNLSVPETLILLSNGFRNNFQGFTEREKDFKEVRTFSARYLKERGIHTLYQTKYFHK